MPTVTTTASQLPRQECVAVSMRCNNMGRPMSNVQDLVIWRMRRRETVRIVVVALMKGL